MKRIISILLIAIMIIPTLISCTKEGATNMTTTTTQSAAPTPKPSASEQMLAFYKGLADDAYANAIKNFWMETSTYSCFHNKYKEDRTTLSELGWNFVMMMLALETYYETTEDEAVKEKIRYYLSEQMNTWATKTDKSWLLATGKGNNPAHDDAAWTAMGFLLIYKLTGNDTALKYCHDMIENSYDYWQDGSTANGIYYSYLKDGGEKEVKSIYCAGLILSSIEYHKITKGTDKEDADLYQRSLDLYEWIEKNMRRDGPREWMGKTYDFSDNLYYCDFIDNKQTGEFMPAGLHMNTNEIISTQSWTSLFGNTAMCVINKRLYDMTGEKSYLDKAISTANALVATDYNNGGTILNDRDAWTNCAFIGYFVREIVPLDEIDPELSRMFMKTVIAIMKNAYYEGGFYGADWDGTGAWIKKDTSGEHTTWIPTNGTTVHMIFATYYLMKNGYIKINDKDLKLLQTNFHVGKLDENGNVIG